MSAPVKIDQQILDAQVKTAPVAIIDFGATWCGPCKKYDPIFEELAKDFNGRVVVGKVDIGEQQAIAQQFGIMSVPTIIILKNGVVAERINGVVPKGTLVEKLNKTLANAGTLGYWSDGVVE